MEAPSWRSRGCDRRATAVAVVVIGVLLAVYGASLLRGDSAVNVAASLEELHANADDVIGERWVVAGEVRQVLSDEVIVIGGGEFGVPATPVLLTARARDVIGGLAPGDVGQFVGRFRRLDVDDLTRQAGGDLPEERLEPLEDGLLLVADRAAIDQRAVRGSRRG